MLVFGITVISQYYLTFSFHKESFDGYTPYVVSMLIFYMIYKSYNYLMEKREISFSPIKIYGLFLVHLLILCILFFKFSSSPGMLGISLFFKIIFYTFLPIIISILSLSLGQTILEKIKGYKEESSEFRFISSFSVGFFAFVSVLTLLLFFNLYNSYGLFAVMAIFGAISYKNLIGVVKNIFDYEIKIKDHQFDSNNFFDNINLKLLTTEFLFIVITFLISVNLINIVRPMPIGWDDLGVYMNYPQILANAGGFVALGGMFSWQIFTGIGYMFQSATQAFFLNNLGSIISAIFIGLSINDLLFKNKKSFINVPLLCASIFLSIPMVIFQQAKDMKLDSGLFFVSISAVYMLFYVFLKYIGYTNETDNNTKEFSKNNIFVNIKNYFLNHFHIGEKDLFDNKNYLIYILIIGIISGFAFSIKVTSLLLISGMIGVIFYSKLGVSGFFSYLLIYVGIFTKVGLWDMMNVVYPKDDMDFRNKFFIYTFLVGTLILIYSIRKYSFNAFKKLIILNIILLLGVFSGLSIWIVKNISMVDSISIGSILGGKADSFNIDYSKIYTKEELNKIEEKDKIQLAVNKSGVTTNEDFGRYFGYEKGINNYVKLPFNLTMQTNQRGEFTDITYIFLALIPCIILFLTFNNSFGIIGAFLISLVPFLSYFNSGVYKILTNFLSQFELPFGYLIISLFFLIPFLYYIYSLNREKSSVLFKLNIVFATFYIFLWTISAFGVVWYGIVMYYSLLLAIGAGAYKISCYEENEDSTKIISKFIGSISVLFLVFFYFFASSFPHGFTNIKNASFGNFKSGTSDYYVSIFQAHLDYFLILNELNLSPKGREELFKEITSQIKNDKIKAIISNAGITDLISLEKLLKNILTQQDEQGNLELQIIKKEANNLLSNLYKNVLYPKKEYTNQKGIYRIGTFLRYFVSENTKRFLEDSLVYQFDKYFYDENNVDTGAERMKKMGVDYFLVDLNAATIDKDSRHDLTRRYENLLKTFTSDKLELITSDSVCLRVSLETYKKSKKTKEDLKNYMYLAGVNYESYTQSGETIGRAKKLEGCYNYIYSLMAENKIDEKNYNYLLPFKNAIVQQNITDKDKLVQLFSSYIPPGWLVLFRIK